MSAKLEGYLEKFHHDEFGDLAVFMSDMHSYYCKIGKV